MSQLDQYLYKIIKYNSGDSEKAYLIIENCVKTNKFLSILSTEIEDQTYILSAIDIEQTFNIENLCIVDIEIKNIQDFIDKVTYIGNNSKEELYICDMLKNIIRKESQTLTNQIKIHTKTLCVINKIKNNENTSSGAVLISNNQEMYTAIVYNTVNGIKKEISSEQIEEIGNVIVRFIMEYGIIDTTDEVVIDKLIKDLEIEILSSCPDWIIAEKIHINKDAIVREINKIQNGEI